MAISEKPAAVCRVQCRTSCIGERGSVALEPQSLFLCLDLPHLDRALFIKLRSSFKGAFISCAQIGVVEDLTARPVDVLDVSRDDPHLLSSRWRRYSQTGSDEDCCSEHAKSPKRGGVRT